jgi:hypothetical protein
VRQRSILNCIFSYTVVTWSLHLTQLYSTSLYYTMINSTLLLSTLYSLLYPTPPYATILYFNLLYYTSLYSTLLYSILLHRFWLMMAYTHNHSKLLPILTSFFWLNLAGSPVLVDVNNDGNVEVLVAVSYYFDKEEYNGRELDFDPSLYVAGGMACWNLQACSRTIYVLCRISFLFICVYSFIYLLLSKKFKFLNVIRKYFISCQLMFLSFVSL